jgi:hypothetical protein
LFSSMKTTLCGLLYVSSILGLAFCELVRYHLLVLLPHVPLRC